MRKLAILFALLFSIQFAFATEVSISNQMEWDDYLDLKGNNIPDGDIVNIESGAVIMTGAISFSNGVINNFGTISFFISIGESNYSTLNNAGCFEITFAPGGTLHNYGIINNTGKFTFSNVGSIDNDGVINTCELLAGNVVGGQNVGAVPLNTICDDGDPTTLDDRIRIENDCSSCAGDPITPVPALTEWGSIILGLCLSIIGMVSTRKML